MNNVGENSSKVVKGDTCIRSKDARKEREGEGNRREDAVMARP